MSTIETADIETVDQLLDAATGRSETLDTDLLTSYDRHRIWALWIDWLKEADGDQVKTLALVVDELADWLAGRRTPVCPRCGSTEILELRDATAYLKVRAITITSSRTISEESDEHSVSVFETAEMWRCQDCDFETEDEDVLVAAAKIGPAELGTRVIVPRVSVTKAIMEGTRIAARIKVFDQVHETWHSLAGPDGKMIPLPVKADCTADEIDAVLQMVAGEVADVLDTITSREDPVEQTSDGTYQMGELFETIGWAVTIQHAKQQLSA